jgi:hypothetical protein
MLNYDDVFADLLKVAEVLAPAEEYTHNGRVVVILEESPSGLARVKYKDSTDPDDDGFSIPKDKLKPLKAPAKKPDPVLAPSTQVSPKDFIAYLRETGFKLYVMLRQLDERQRVAEEYSSWTGGETLPDAAIKDYSGTPGTFQREWVLTTRYSDNMPSPCPIEEGGTVGQGRGHLIEPHGVRNSKTVTFRSPETIRDVLQAGLRPQ